VHRIKRWAACLFLGGCLSPYHAFSQIDPYPRELIQFGYNASFQGHPPVAGYAFYYRNRPNFYSTNLTLRLAIAPTYVDSELGISRALGEHTDVGIGFAGGGFADSYDEIRQGTLIPKESFTGHGAETSASIYHCFNEGALIPLNGVFRGILHYATYGENDNTAKTFLVPEDQTSFSIRAGVRWGGKEPTLYPSLAMELSAWYEGEYRFDPNRYGDTTVAPQGDRSVKQISHLFWGTALLAYTFTNSGQSFYINLTTGTSLEPDRFSAYRLGALLPLVSEFPLSLPGYYYQELSARQFSLLGGNYMVPLDPKRRWNMNFTITTAYVDYLNRRMSQPGSWNTGIGGGVLYQSSSIKIMLGYAYGVNAIRDGGRGAHSIGLLLQLDMEHARQTLFNPEEPGRWRGFQKIFGAFND
jgi:hypothetical protein